MIKSLDKQKIQALNKEKKQVQSAYVGNLGTIMELHGLSSFEKTL